jgi:hypothetical protein
MVNSRRSAGANLLALMLAARASASMLDGGDAFMAAGVPVTMSDNGDADWRSLRPCQACLPANGVSCAA